MDLSPFPASDDEMLDAIERRLGSLGAVDLAPDKYGLCFDCPALATTPCPDNVARCDDHAKAYARQIIAATPKRHCSTAAAKKARANRRAKAKRLRRGGRS